MRPWAKVLVFVVGYFLAFGGTAIITYVGQNPMWVWGLFVLVGLWFWQLPLLKDLDSRLTLVCLYAFPFLGFWIFTNPPPASTDRTFIFGFMLLLLGLGSAFLARSTMAMYRRVSGLRPFILACLALFVCCWLIAFFSASTGAASHWVQVLVSLFHLSSSRAESFAVFCRKCLHFLFYGTVGWCAFQVARRGGAGSRAVLLALLFVLFHASFDEIRQASFPDRTSSVWDVCLDLAGAVAFVSIARLRSEPPPWKASAGGPV